MRIAWSSPPVLDHIHRGVVRMVLVSRLISSCPPVPVRWQVGRRWDFYTWGWLLRLRRREKQSLQTRPPLESPVTERTPGPGVLYLRAESTGHQGEQSAGKRAPSHLLCAKRVEEMNVRGRSQDGKPALIHVLQEVCVGSRRRHE